MVSKKETKNTYSPYSIIKQAENRSPKIEYSIIKHGNDNLHNS
jgi:hypothetical protein